MSGQQDMPPKGGFPQINYKRNIPKSRIPGLMLFAGFGIVAAYTGYKVMSYNWAERARREKAVVVRTKDLNDMQRREDIKNFMRTRQQFEEEYKKGGGGHH
ncbi:hypothetical protein AAMO2058_000010700 [Amorphochlora amoebiformis]